MLHPIMVVHRQQAMREIVVRALDEAGFVGIPALTGDEVLEYLQSGGRAAVILRQDADDEGWARFARARRDDSRLARIPVIALSPLGRRGAYQPRHDEYVDVSALVMIVRHLCQVNSPIDHLHGFRPPLAQGGLQSIDRPNR